LGGNTYSIVQFAFDPSFDPTPTGVNVLDVVDLGMIGPNITFTILPPEVGVKTLLQEKISVSEGVKKADGSVITLNSANQPLTGPCTPGVTSAPDLILNPNGSFHYRRQF
jgi:hypothetical protein